MTLEADIGCLRQLPLFRTLPQPRLKLVALMGEKLHFEPGMKIFEEGELPDGVYVIIGGEVELLHETEDGRRKHFLIETGAMVGDVAVLSGQGFAGKLMAKSAVTALRLPKDLFFELLQTIPDFSIAVSRDLASRLYRLANFVLHDDRLAERETA
ncbi:MAG: cyclic nucleotide-binding protein [Chelatococcus sp.]|nr:MAG: cyclic nucleotide-binding protein [Chelatococcus sp.]